MRPRSGVQPRYTPETAAVAGTSRYWDEVHEDLVRHAGGEVGEYAVQAVRNDGDDADVAIFRNSMLYVGPRALRRESCEAPVTRSNTAPRRVGRMAIAAVLKAAAKPECGVGRNSLVHKIISGRATSSQPGHCGVIVAD